MPTSSDDALAALATASAGLLLPSEQDAPFAPFLLPGRGPVTPSRLRAALELPPSAPVETRTLAAFFAPLARAERAETPEERAVAARFAALAATFAELLDDPVVYRVGVIDITVLILGRLPDGRFAGLRSAVVET
jgi:hypothetical protein